MSQEFDLESWTRRFEQLQKEARGFGIRSVVVLIDQDPLSDTEGKSVNYIGMGPVLIMGAGQMLLALGQSNLLQRDADEGN